MNLSIKHLVLTGVICLAIGIAVGYALLKSGTQKADIKIKYGDSELNINLDKNELEAAKFLKQIFSEDFSKQGTLEWLKDNEHLFQPEDPDIVPEIAKLKFDANVAKELRDLSIKRIGPWAYQFDTVYIGIPDSVHQPRQDFANVCANGKYFKEKIRIYSLNRKREIEVMATGKYDCPPGYKFPDVQLNPKDAERLLGTYNFAEYEQGMALILIQD